MRDVYDVKEIPVIGGKICGDGTILGICRTKGPDDFAGEFVWYDVNENKLLTRLDATELEWVSEELTDLPRAVSCKGALIFGDYMEADEEDMSGYKLTVYDTGSCERDSAYIQGGDIASRTLLINERLAGDDCFYTMTIPELKIYFLQIYGEERESTAYVLGYDDKNWICIGKWTAAADEDLYRMKYDSAHKTALLETAYSTVFIRRKCDHRLPNNRSACDADCSDPSAALKPDVDGR